MRKPPEKWSAELVRQRLVESLHDRTADPRGTAVRQPGIGMAGNAAAFVCR
jgi:hypothetical protein